MASNKLPITSIIVVKNESKNLQACITSIQPFVDEILVADTGSTDNTCTILRETFNINPFHSCLKPEECFSLASVRNMLIGEAKNGWILTLDADESIDFQNLNQLRKNLRRNTHGYFGLWINKTAENNIFHDYKLFLFRKSIQMRGLVHENVTLNIRRKGLNAAWTNSFKVIHRDTKINNSAKQNFRRQRLLRAIELEPHNARYYWFLGLTCLEIDTKEEAIKMLKNSLKTESDLFPIERINSGIMLTKLCIQADLIKEATKNLKITRNLFDYFKDDFEFAANPDIEESINQLSAILYRETDKSTLQLKKYSH